MDKTHDGRPFRTLNVIDEISRESLAIKVKQNLKSEDVLECLTELFCTKGIPDQIWSVNRSKFSANQVLDRYKKGYQSSAGLTRVKIGKNRYFHICRGVPF